jgi:hypothetical protein
MRRAWALILAVVTAAASPGVVAVGAPGPESDVRAWVETQVREGIRLASLSNVVWEYTVDRPFVESAETRFAVRGFKPGDAKINRTSYATYWEDKASWRFNQSFPGNTWFLDNCLTRSDAWQTMPAALVIHRSSTAFAPGHDFRPLIGTPSAAFRECVTGFLSPSEAGVPDLTNFRSSGDTFVVDVIQGEVITFQVEGRFNPALARGFVSTVTIIQSSLAGEAGMRSEYEGWHESGVRDLWVPRSVTVRTAKGDLNRQYVELAIRPAIAEEFPPLFAVPKVGGKDAIRGVIDFSQFDDYRPDDPKTVFLHAPGAPAQNLVPPREPGPWLVRGAWIASSVVAATVLGLGIRRYLR